jgi:hypothetical protein
VEATSRRFVFPIHPKPGEPPHARVPEKARSGLAPRVPCELPFRSRSKRRGIHALPVVSFTLQARVFDGSGKPLFGATHGISISIP